MIVKMLETKNGSPDGVRVNGYEKGGVYDLPSPLAEVFIAEKWAIEAKITRQKESKRLNPNREDK